MKIAVWGVGKIAYKCMEDGIIDEKRVDYYIDNYNKRDFKSKKVITPKEFVDRGIVVDFILVLNSYSEEIYEQCIELGIDLNKVVFCENYRYKISELITINKKQKNVGEFFPRLQKKIEEDCQSLNAYALRRQNGILTLKCNYDDIETPLINNCLLEKKYYLDYSRYRTFELCANEVIKNNLPGSVAEIGVFSGKFASLINKKFPDRKLYLFDTFESFDKEEFNREVKLGRWTENMYEIFLDTSIERVMSLMNYPEKVIITKGYFPDSVKDAEFNEQFAFVSIDVDLEISTYNALVWIYPRLVSKGYIFIHDYNNNVLEGVKVAIDRYEKDYGVSLIRVPISDWGGTVIICKP